MNVVPFVGNSTPQKQTATNANQGITSFQEGGTKEAERLCLSVKNVTMSSTTPFQEQGSGVRLSVSITG